MPREPRKNPYAPLAIYGSIALPMWVAYFALGDAVCRAVSNRAPTADCDLPLWVALIPAVILLFGIVETIKNLRNNDSDHDRHG